MKSPDKPTNTVTIRRNTPKTNSMMKYCFGTDDEYIAVKDVARLEREYEEQLMLLDKAYETMTQLVRVRVKDWKADRGGMAAFSRGRMEELDSAIQAIDTLINE